MAAASNVHIFRVLFRWYTYRFLGLLLSFQWFHLLERIIVLSLPLGNEVSIVLREIIGRDLGVLALRSHA